MPGTTSKIEVLLLKLWASKQDAVAVTAICKELLEEAPNDLRGVDMYLPQFAHMVIACADDLQTIAPIEHFLLTISQLSIHLALHFFWMVYTALLENRLKNGGNRATYARCAKLLLQLEQCVAYGGAQGKSAGNGSATARQRELLTECARVASAAKSSDGVADGTKEFVIDGILRKKGGGERRCGRRTWHDRYFVIRDRILYYYSSQAEASASNLGRGSLMLHTAEVTNVEGSTKYPFYFEVRNKQNGSKFCLCAPSREAMVRWIAAITNASALPAPPGLSAAQERELLEDRAVSDAPIGQRTMALAKRYSSMRSTSKEDDIDGDLPTSPAVQQPQDTSAKSVHSPTAAMDSPTFTAAADAIASSDSVAEVYTYYNSQREFIRALTNIAEELRFLNAEERQGALQPKLDGLSLPPRTYFPLATSADRCQSLLRITPNESIVFNTKARCPIMLICEVRTETFVLSDLRTHIGSGVGGAPGPVKVASSDVAPASPTAPGTTASDVKLVVNSEPLTAGDRKREKWGDKVERVRGASQLAKGGTWNLTSFIVKSNDDLRQEVFIMQMLRYFQSIWPEDLTWLNCYHIEATGPDTGLIETITGSSDLDRLKKAEGYTTLRDLFIQRHGQPGTDAFLKAQDNFCRSLAGYSVAMWLLKLRDRHNGNLMLDDEGHYFHIDFGFCLEHSTGKGIGGMVECSAFKLTEEYIAVLDGRDSPVFKKYCDGCVAAILAAFEKRDTIVAMVEIVGQRSNFPCFLNAPVGKIIQRLKQRLFFGKTKDQVEADFRKLILTKAAGHWGSRRYDWFQNKQQGYAI